MGEIEEKRHYDLRREGCLYFDGKPIAGLEELPMYGIAIRRIIGKSAELRDNSGHVVNVSEVGRNGSIDDNLE